MLEAETGSKKLCTVLFHVKLGHDYHVEVRFVLGFIIVQDNIPKRRRYQSFAAELYRLVERRGVADDYGVHKPRKFVFLLGVVCKILYNVHRKHHCGVKSDYCKQGNNYAEQKIQLSAKAFRV